ncbi:MAG: hypothetical protein IPP12_12780 [Nitrospira sp.]|nr:hypothetical protein [Nitrospira sp.]
MQTRAYRHLTAEERETAGLAQGLLRWLEFGTGAETLAGNWLETSPSTPSRLGEAQAATRPTPGAAQPWIRCGTRGCARTDRRTAHTQYPRTCRSTALPKPFGGGDAGGPTERAVGGIASAARPVAHGREVKTARPIPTRSPAGVTGGHSRGWGMAEVPRRFREELAGPPAETRPHRGARSDFFASACGGGHQREHQWLLPSISLRGRTCRYTQRELNAIAHRLNTRPRKGLNFATPLEVFTQLRYHSPVALGS